MRSRRSRFLFVLPTMLAVVAMLSCSSLQNLPNPFATATPTATATFAPTITPSPTPTFTPTATPLPTGVDVEPASDGTSLVRDWDNGYGLVLPSDWMALPLTKDEASSIIEEAGKLNPEAAAVLDQLRKADPDMLRLVGMCTNVKYAKASFPTMVIVMSISSPGVGIMPMDYVMSAMEKNALPGATDQVTKLKTNPNGVELGILQGTMRQAISPGLKTTVRLTAIFFQSNKKMVMVEFMTPPQFATDVQPTVDEVADSIQLYKP